MKPLASIRTSKGCPYRYKFCAMWKVAEGHYFKRNPEKIVEELAGIEEECDFFSDDKSLLDASRMSRLAQLIKEAGIKKNIFFMAGVIPSLNTLTSCGIGGISGWSEYLWGLNFNAMKTSPIFARNQRQGIMSRQSGYCTISPSTSMPHSYYDQSSPTQILQLLGNIARNWN